MVICLCTMTTRDRKIVCKKRSISRSNGPIVYRDSTIAYSKKPACRLSLDPKGSSATPSTASATNPNFFPLGCKSVGSHLCHLSQVTAIWTDQCLPEKEARLQMKQNRLNIQVLAQSGSSTHFCKVLYTPTSQLMLSCCLQWRSDHRPACAQIIQLQ